MQKKLLFIIVGLGLSIPTISKAEQDYKGRWEVGVRAGGIFFEGDSALDEDGVYGAHVGYNMTQHWAVEAAAVTGKTQIQRASVHGGPINTKNPKGEVEVLVPSLELQYNFGSSRVRPFVAVGVADFHQNPDTEATIYGQRSSKSDDFAVQYGAGIKWLLTQHFVARLDLKHLINTEYGYKQLGYSHNDGILTGGLSWLFGGKGIEAPKPAVVQKPVDSDNDGVIDANDTCPGTAAGVTVDARGCAIPKDSDGDGVLDENDRCPNTLAGSKVDANGCILVVDTDGDGVADDKDECPNTPPQTVVEATGCPATVKAIEDNWVLKGVNFETNSDKIKAESLPILDEAANVLKARSKVRVEIQGHTDSLGDDALNQKLSDRRANSVKNYLVQKGVSASQLETKGLGETSPIAENKTVEGRSQNRRIEFKVLSR